MTMITNSLLSATERLRNYRGNAIFEPKESVYKRAKDLIENYEAKNSSDVFALVSAINYIVSYHNYYNLPYKYKRVFEGLLWECKKHFPVVLAYYAHQNNKVYIEVYDILFTFDATGLDYSILDKLLKGSPLTLHKQNNKLNPEIILNEALKVDNLTFTKRRTSDIPLINKTNGKGISISFSFVPLEINNIIRDLHLDEMTTTEVSARNIAIVIQKIYFQIDLLNKCNLSLPTSLLQSHYREVIIESYGVVECIRREIGALLLNRVRDHNLGEKGDFECEQAVDKLAPIRPNSPEKKMFDCFKNKRNNVHLSKTQNILDKDTYNPKIVSEIFDYMTQYIQYLYRRYKKH